ncbi:MAG: transposase [Desulfobacterales bacterium]
MKNRSIWQYCMQKLRLLEQNFLPHHPGKLMSVHITAGNTDDRKPVRDMVKHLKGKLFGDKGYICAVLAEDPAAHGLQLITTLKKI